MISENNNITITTISIRNGLVASILMMLLTMLFFWISGAGSSPVIVWNHFILLIVMYFGVRKYKHTFEEGLISFKQCYISGLIIGLITAFFFALFMIIYTKYIDKDLIAFFIKVNEEKYKHYITGAELQNQINILIRYSTPIWMGVRAFVEIALVGLFMPLLMGIFFKKEKIEETNN